MPKQADLDRLSGLTRQILGDTLTGIRAKQRAEQEQAQKQQDIDTATNLQQQLGEDTPISVGDVRLGGRDRLADFLKAQQLQSMQDERTEKAVERGSKALIESGLPQAQQAFKRVESITPGLVSGQEKPKSVGGVKSLIPNIAVSPLESIGLLPKGSAEERSALQELANVKIYDASGKAINEAEMRRIQDALGMRGITDPNAIQSALAQMGMTIVTKGETAEAGIRPEARQILQERGAVSVDPLRKLIQRAPASNQQTKKIGGKTYRKVPGGWEEVE